MTLDTTFRVATPADREQILAVVAEAFGHDEDVALVKTIWGLEGHLPSLELVAVTDRHVIGHVLYSEGRIGDTVVPGLAPLAVAPARQRMGIGSALVTRSLALAELAGHRLVVVTGRPAYYGRFGFVAASTFGIVPSNPEDFRDLHAFMVKPLGGRTTPRGTFTYAWQSHGLSLGGD